MKPNLTKPLSVILGIILCTVISSCEKNLFDAEKTKKAYEEAFPVKDIDPAMDWKTTRATQVSIVVNEDWGTNYKVQIFDANPLNSQNKAKLLAEGYANQNLAFETVMDCPIALSTVFVARVDEKGRYLVQPVSLLDGSVSVSFGDVVTQATRAMTRASEMVPSVNAPYTDVDINAMLATATEVKQGWDLTANWGGGEAGTEDVFRRNDRIFKITNNTVKTFSAKSTGKNVKLIVASDNVILPSEFSNSLEIIVANGAKVALNNTVTLKTNCHLIVMPGGNVQGTGTLAYTNRSYGVLNYNGGTIDIGKLDFTGSDPNAPADAEYPYYNYGELRLTTYSSTTPNSVLVNRGAAYIGTLNGNNNTDVKSACYLEVTNNLRCRNLVVGSNSKVKCGSLNHDGTRGLEINMESSSMIDCLGQANLVRKITGPTTGTALFKLNSITPVSIDLTTSFIKNNIICEVTDQTSNEGVKSDWSPTRSYTWSVFDWMVYKLLQNGASYCNPGKANFTLPDGDCTGDGYEGEGGGDPVDPDPITYTYAYEDNYPYPGDYDFNDIVLDVTPKYIRDAANKIQQIEFNINLKAIGGVKMHGAALRLIGVNKGQISNISFSDPNNMRNTLGKGALFDNVLQESSDPNLVIPIFGDAHKIAGYGGNDRPMLNTDHSGPSFTPVALTLTLTLTDQTKTTPLLTNDNLDFFIGYPGALSTRAEVHLYEFRSYGATAKGVVHLENMVAAGKITWAVCVPGFKYPTEKTVITSAYPDFDKWATTGGLNPEFADWYLHPTTDAGKIY